MKNDVVDALSEASEASEREFTRVYPKHKPVYAFVKRCFDVVCSILGMIVLFVPLLIVALIIVIDSPGASPVYVQQRI